MCCLLCFDDSPLQPDEKDYSLYVAGANQWNSPMQDACCANPCCCLFGSLCIPCAQCYIRKATLEHIHGENWSEHYECCQGYSPCCNDTIRDCSKGNVCCLCVESWCCSGFAMSATKFVMQDHYNITTDPCDVRLIRFNNCMQCLACVCEVMALINGSFRDCAQLVRCVADITFMTMMGCMVAQVKEEINFRDAQKA